MYSCVFPVCVSVYHVHTVPKKARREQDQKIPGTGLMYDCELPRGWWELSSGPLEKVVSALNL